MNPTNPAAAHPSDVPSERRPEAGEHRDINGKAMAVSFLMTAVFDIGLAIVAFRVAKHLGASDPAAYLACGIGPLTMQVITWIRAKVLSGSSVIVLLILCL